MAQGTPALQWVASEQAGLAGSYTVNHERLAEGLLNQNVYQWTFAFDDPDAAFHMRMKFG